MAYEFENLVVMVVEDNLPMMELIKSLLLTFGVGRTVTAIDGAQAFDRFCKHNPDLIITDWMMEPDGIEFTRRVRNDPKSPNKFVPIILMTGFSEKQRVMEARDVGVNEFLVKPFNARDLYRRIAQVIERPRQYVRSEDFFGPDRRRVRKEEYDGPKRRGSEEEKNKIHSSYISTLQNVTQKPDNE